MPINGSGGCGHQHTTRLSIDGVTVMDDIAPALPTLGVQEWHDVAYVFLTPGTHRVQIEVDVFDDASNESDELDNIYWRIVEVVASASATIRNAGSNPASYTAATLPVLGTTYTGVVNLAGTTWHTYAFLAAYFTPWTFTMTGGQTILLNPGDPNGELLGLPAAIGPIATFDLHVPADIALAGLNVFTQALHIGGVQPWALSNAQDLILGY